ncbi:MAG: cytochrome c-type biogenesis protein, partial [Alphaproteobacteria bacterium]
MTLRCVVRAVLAAALVAVTMALAATAANAVGANEALPDPALEARARELFKELRCLVCQNQSIDDSDAELARDLRILVRERLQAGDSNAEVIRFLTNRYGDFVLLKPPLKPSTVALWTAPFALLLIGGAVAVLRLRARRAVTV